MDFRSSRAANRQQKQTIKIKTFDMKNTITLILVFLNPFLAFSQKAEHRNLEDKLAIHGYDPVS